MLWWFKFHEYCALRPVWRWGRIPFLPHFRTTTNPTIFALSWYPVIDNPIKPLPSSNLSYVSIIEPTSISASTSRVLNNKRIFTFAHCISMDKIETVGRHLARTMYGHVSRCLPVLVNAFIPRVVSDEIALEKAVQNWLPSSYLILHIHCLRARMATVGLSHGISWEINNWILPPTCRLCVMIYLWELYHVWLLNLEGMSEADWIAIYWCPRRRWDSLGVVYV